MFSNLPIKRKFYLLLAGFTFMLFIIYILAVKSTFIMINSCNNLNNSLLELRNAPSEIQIINKKISELEKLIKKQNDSEVSNHLELLNFISNNCKKNNLIIKEYPQAQEYKKGQYTVETNIIRLEGDYQFLLKLLYNLEQHYRNGHISSILFESLPDYRNDIYRLNLVIYEQNISENTFTFNH